MINLPNWKKYAISQKEKTESIFAQFFPDHSQVLAFTHSDC